MRYSAHLMSGYSTWRDGTGDVSLHHLTEVVPAGFVHVKLLLFLFHILLLEMSP